MVWTTIQTILKVWEYTVGSTKMHQKAILSNNLWFPKKHAFNVCHFIFYFGYELVTFFNFTDSILHGRDVEHLWSLTNYKSIPRGDCVCQKKNAMFYVRAHGKRIEEGVGFLNSVVNFTCTLYVHWTSCICWRKLCHSNDCLIGFWGHSLLIHEERSYVRFDFF